MLMDRLIQSVLERLMNRMREIETVKGPHLVYGYSLQRIAQIAERAKHGTPVTEPYGSSREVLTLDSLFFLPAMVDRFPVDEKSVSTETVVGPSARRPLILQTPLMISAMSYTVSVTRRCKICMARGSSMAGSATNSGDAGFCVAERRNARKYVVQYNRGGYQNRPEQLRQADAIEIRFGQGALAGMAETIEGEDMDEEMAAQLNVEPGQSASRPFRHRELSSPEDLRGLVDNLRQVSEGVPVGVKFGAGRIEADLDRAVDAGVDFVTVDGSHGGTAGSYETTINNTGVPIAYAIRRAALHLKRRGVDGKTSLIVCGGLRDSGDFAKALALGADAVYSATSVLTALSYAQIPKLPPGTSPLELYMNFGDFGDRLDVEEGSEAVGNFLSASTTEMAILTGAVGKTRVSDLCIEDLVATSDLAAAVTGVAKAW